jgi:hypothetical protein
VLEAKLHAWYWLDRPITCKQAKQWLKQACAPVDLSLYCPVHIHYSAGPLFHDGRPDPIKDRVVMVDGADMVHVPEIKEPPKPEPTKFEGPIERTALVEILGRVIAAVDGRRNTTLYACSCRLGEAIRDGAIEEDRAIRYLTGAVKRMQQPLAGEEALRTSQSGLQTGKSTVPYSGFTFEDKTHA